MPRLLDAAGREISSQEVARARASASAGAGATPAYAGAARNDPATADWNPTIRSPDREWLPQMNSARARARDTFRNDPIGRAGVKRKRHAAVGRGWRLSARPNAAALGITRKAARELARAIETEWTAHAYGHAFEIDAERSRSFGQLLGLAASHDRVDGEAFALTEWAEDEDTRYKTRLRIVHPDRVSNPNGRRDDAFLRAGIERNRAGVPVRYWIREQHPVELGYSTSRFAWQAFDRFTAWGRPQVLHCFDAEAAGQTRGVTAFAASLKNFRCLSRFTDATLQAATVHAFMVAFAKSNGGPGAINDALTIEDAVKFEDERTKYYKENPISLAGGVRIPVLPHGDEIELQSQSKDVTSYDVFTRSIIRLIASSLGVTYEELTMDYSQTNYSSARAAMGPAWSDTVDLVARLEAQIVKPYYVAWLEEAFDRGYIQAPEGAPDFYDAIDAYAEAKWIGPGRGYIDPTKEIDAAAARIEAGISTLEDECAEQGKDWREVREQRAYELEYDEELGLDPEAEPGSGLDSAAEAARDPARDRDLDQKPTSALARLARGVGSALARVRRTARSAEHEAFLDRRAA